MATDARVRYTKMIIEKTFIDLLKTKPLNKITVKEICDAAEINRTTFYKHYEDVFDLLNKIEADLIKDFQKTVENTKSMGIKISLIEILNKIKNNKDKYETIFKIRGLDYFNEKLFNGFNHEIVKLFDLKLTELSVSNQKWLFYFLSFGCGGICNCWVKTGMNEPVEEIADIIEDLVKSALKTITKN